MTYRLNHLASVLCALIALTPPAATQGKTITVGSKKFTESYVLGDIAKRLLERAGFSVVNREGVGATAIVWEALKSGDIDVYPEYTGTIKEELLKLTGQVSDAELASDLRPLGIGMSKELGFNNTYALVMRRQQADQLNIHKISDLKGHTDLRVAVSHEFLERKDGWRPLAARYGLNFPNVGGVDHGLAYASLDHGDIDVTDAYSTDAEIHRYSLEVLQDDLGFFPQYRAVYLYRLGLDPEAVAALNSIGGQIDEARMTAMNDDAVRTKDYDHAAATFFSNAPAAPTGVDYGSIARNTLVHLELVGVSLLLAIIVGIPLGIRAARPGVESQFILGIAGIIQTIPSLALLLLLVPIAGLGLSVRTAIAALFLYSLLPIIRNTAAGLQNIPGSVRESAEALGLEPGARLRKIYLPMASRTMLAGIKTSAIINIGTATLAAFIGAGGLGTAIVSGLAINDMGTVMQGAIPAAALALVAGWVFDLLDLAFIPRGLRLKGEGA